MYGRVYLATDVRTHAQIAAMSISQMELLPDMMTYFLVTISLRAHFKLVKTRRSVIPQLSTATWEEYITCLEGILLIVTAR